MSAAGTVMRLAWILALLFVGWLVIPFPDLLAARLVVGGGILCWMYAAIAFDHLLADLAETVDIRIKLRLEKRTERIE